MSKVERRCFQVGLWALATGVWIEVGANSTSRMLAIAGIVVVVVVAGFGAAFGAEIEKLIAAWQRRRNHEDVFRN